MEILSLKPSHKAITAYYQELEAYARLGVTHEMAVRDAFQALLKVCCAQANLTFVGEWKIKRQGRAALSVDGAMVGIDELARGYWEAKDAQDELAKEVKRKFAVGYPNDNIIFQSPVRAILYQNGRQVLDEDITRPEILVGTLKQFFEYRAPQIEKWEEAAAKFQERVPELAESVVKLIERERKTNKKFIAAFAEFTELCRASINPNISDQAVEEMLIQHLLTERIFRNVFDNPDFAGNNIIAVEIEKVIRALTSQTFSRAEFLKSNDYFYRALEETAATIEDFSQKQSFLNSVYERFFQGFSVKVADTHGIVYTPQPIVNFMVKSVEDILRQEFGKSLSDAGVHVLDPFVGTGNFMIRVMQEIKRTRLQEKYAGELHCNEVMLLPYYIASMNIEHAFYDLTKTYQPFAGICLVDTFELAEGKQGGLFTEENTARIERQKQQKLFVIIGNPPYNVGQVNENDNNKNRKYKQMDKRVAETYAKASKATNKNALSDPYVKAIRWASDKIEETGEGVIALVTNNSFLEQIAFDGMRKELSKDFDAIYVLDLGGNVRKNPKLSGTTHNVFGIQVGVSINLFVRRRRDANTPHETKIYYARVGEDWRKEEKYKFLDEAQDQSGVEWQELQPDANHTWLTEGMQDEFTSFIPIGNKGTRNETVVSAIFQAYSRGCETGRDSWVYNFDRNMLLANVER
ncbi:MAG: N-6 DNA methylase, partial [Acidobacteriota bacterium]|nr:N-6 DNA methylase [Acidobacteriota bacterium]